MKKLIMMILLLTAASLVFGLVTFNNEDQTSLLKEQNENSHYRSYTISDGIRGAVVPHHDLVSDIIGGFYHSIRNKGIKRIFLIGPDHKSIGRMPVSVSAIGNAVPDSVGDLLEDFRSLKFVVEDDALVRNEHSITSHLPYIHKELGEVEIVSIVISNSGSMEEMKRLFLKIAENLDEHSIIVCSIDFSHGQSLPSANKFDDVTLDLISRGFVDGILSLDDRNVDAALLLAGVVDFTNEEGFSWDVHDHENSANILGLNLVNSTSYYLLEFH